VCVCVCVCVFVCFTPVYLTHTNICLHEVPKQSQPRLCGYPLSSSGLSNTYIEFQNQH